MRDRIESPDKGSEMCSLFLGVLSIPRVVERVDGFLVLPGEGEHWRLTEAIYWWQSEKSSARSLLIAGHNTREKTSEILDLGRLQMKPYNLRRLEGVHLAIHAESTLDQMIWPCDKIKELDIKSIALFVSPYHQVRAYLTLLEALLARGYEVVLIPAPMLIPLDTVSPENGVDMWTLIPGEVSRIDRYQQEGCMVSLTKLKRYLGWLWQQPILQR